MGTPQQLFGQVNVSNFIYISTQANIYPIFVTLERITYLFGWFTQTVLILTDIHAHERRRHIQPLNVLHFVPCTNP